MLEKFDGQDCCHNFCETGNLSLMPLPKSNFAPCIGIEEKPASTRNVFIKHSLLSFSTYVDLAIIIV